MGSVGCCRPEPDRGTSSVCRCVVDIGMICAHDKGGIGVVCQFFSLCGRLCNIIDETAGWVGDILVSKEGVEIVANDVFGPSIIISKYGVRNICDDDGKSDRFHDRKVGGERK